MTTGALLPARIRKEVRGLTGAWLASLSVIAVALFGDLRAAGVLGYLVGAVALGSLSMGQEYNGRTMTVLLSQPSSRERLFFRKFGVLVAMLASLAAVAWVGLLSPRALAGSLNLTIEWQTLAFGLPILCGLFLAPWLTMVCRNALAGIIFAIAVPGAIWLASEWTSTLIYGPDLSTLPAATALAVDVFWRGMLCVSTVGAISTWVMFMRLEAIDSRGLDLHLPSWLFPRPAANDSVLARRHSGPVWLLIGKELRLQQLTFAVSGLYLIGWLGLALFGQFLPQPQYRGVMLAALTVLHSGAIPLIAGSVASAEERHLGTLGWQVLFPISTRTQWALKTAVVIAISLGLALALPSLLSLLSASAQVRGEMPSLLTTAPIIAVVATAIVSLYVSSVSANGLRALLVALPAAVGLNGLAIYILSLAPYGRYGQLISGRYGLISVPKPPWSREFFGVTENILAPTLTILMALAVAGLLAMLLRFAMANHRSAEGGGSRVWKQVSWIVGTVALWSVVWFSVFTVYVKRVDALAREVDHQWMARQATAVFDIKDRGALATKDALVVIFLARQSQGAATFLVVPPDSAGAFIRRYLPPVGAPSAIAVARPGAALADLERDLLSQSALRERLKAVANPFSLQAGETTTVSLELTRIP